MVRVFANDPGGRSVQFQVNSYQRLRKWFFIQPCLTLHIIRYGARVKWSNPGKEVAPSPTVIENGSFGSPSATGANFTYMLSSNYFYTITIFTNPSARAGYDTRSVFKRSLTGLNSEFSFS